MLHVVAALLVVMFRATAAVRTGNAAPADEAWRAVAALGPLVDDCLADLGPVDRGHAVVRVWMRDGGDPKLNGCGFYFRVDGDAGGSDRDFFPRYQQHRCDDGVYQMRVTSPGRAYGIRLRLGRGERAVHAEVHADGWHSTFVRALCVGFGARSVAGGPRAICVNSAVLKACKRLTGKWSHMDVDGSRDDDVLMTRTVRGTHKIVFRDVDGLLGGFERLRAPDGDGSEEALNATCDRINLVRGDYGDRDDTCPAETTSAADIRHSIFKNPYGCFIAPPVVQ